MDQEVIARIYAAYRNNFVAELEAFSEDFHRRAFQYLSEERGHRAIRPIYMRMMSMIPSEGIRLSQLAVLLDMNVQHCMDLLQEFEETGYVRRSEDPLDSRARLVHLTRRGKSLVYDGIDFGKLQDPHYQSRLGAARFAEFERISGELNDGMGFSGLRSRQYPEYLDKTGSQLYGHLFQAAAYAARFIRRHLEISGHAGLKENTRWLVGQIGIGGTTIAEIAELRGISVQAMGRIVKEAEAAGYVKTLPDAADRRRKILMITERGLELLAAIVDARAQLEQEFSGVLGRKKFQRFKAAVAAISGRQPAAGGSTAAAPHPTLFYRQSEKRPVRLGGEPLTRLQLLLYIAFLLDGGEPRQDRAALTQSISASVSGDTLLTLTEATLAALNTTSLSLDDIETRLTQQFGKKSAAALAPLLAALKQAL